MKFLSNIILVALMGVLTACANVNSALSQQSRATVDELLQADYFVQENHPDAILNVLYQARVNQTVRFYDSGHGVQIEYYSPNGQAFLWYPGNKRVVIGQWAVTHTRKGPALCFNYGSLTYNPVTGDRDGQNCTQAREILAKDGVVDQAPGDPYNLSSGVIPFVLDSQRMPNWPQSPHPFGY